MTSSPPTTAWRVTAIGSRGLITRRSRVRIPPRYCPETPANAGGFVVWCWPLMPEAGHQSGINSMGSGLPEAGHVPASLQSDGPRRRGPESRRRHHDFPSGAGMQTPGKSDFTRPASSLQTTTIDSVWRCALVRGCPRSCARGVSAHRSRSRALSEGGREPHGLENRWGPLGPSWLRIPPPPLVRAESRMGSGIAASLGGRRGGSSVGQRGPV
jgi:hypothetical protein